MNVYTRSLLAPAFLTFAITLALGTATPAHAESVNWPASLKEIFSMRKGSQGPNPSNTKRWPKSKLPSGQIVVADSFGAVLTVDSNGVSIISSGENLQSPFGVAIDANQNVVVSDTGVGLVRLDPVAGTQTIITRMNETLGCPFGIAIEADGHILVANADSIMRVDPNTGNSTLVSKGNNPNKMMAPIGVTVSNKGNIYVTDIATASVFQIDEKIADRSNNQILVSRGGFLNFPAGITVDQQENIYVAEQGNYLSRTIKPGVVKIKRNNGGQVAILNQDNLQDMMSPVGIAMTKGSPIYVGDPDAFGLLGGVYSILTTGKFPEISNYVGNESFQNPRGLAIVP